MTGVIYCEKAIILEGPALLKFARLRASDKYSAGILRNDNRGKAGLILLIGKKFSYSSGFS